MLRSLLAIALVVLAAASAQAQAPAKPAPLPATVTMPATEYAALQNTVAQQTQVIDALQKAIDGYRIQLEIVSNGSQRMAETIVGLRKQQELEQVRAQARAEKAAAAKAAAKAPVEKP